MNLSNLKIPSNVKFSDLELERDPETGDVSLDFAVIECICAFNGISANTFAVNEDALSLFQAAWYQAHLQAGGEPHPVQEDIIANGRPEDVYRGGY